MLLDVIFNFKNQKILLFLSLSKIEISHYYKKFDLHIILVIVICIEIQFSICFVKE